MSKYTHFTTISDSLSCLQSFHRWNIKHPYILDILYSNHYFTNQFEGELVILYGIPSHFGIHGINDADKAAKSATSSKL